MKIAICLSGYVGTMKKFHHLQSQGQVNILEGYETIKKNVIGGHDTDIFVHSWDTSRKDEILQTYDPHQYIIEPQKNDLKLIPGISRPESTSEFAVLSQLYSRKKVIEMVLKYEKENYFKYDWVWLGRFDMAYLKKFEYDKLDNSFLYFAGPNQNHKVNDIYYLSNSTNMEKVVEAYDYMARRKLQDGFNVHEVLGRYFVETGLWNKKRFYMHRPWGPTRWNKIADINPLRMRPSAAKTS